MEPLKFDTNAFLVATTEFNKKMKILGDAIRGIRRGQLIRKGISYGQAPKLGPATDIKVRSVP